MEGHNSDEAVQLEGSKTFSQASVDVRPKAGMEAALESGEFYLRNPSKGAARCRKRYLDENQGLLLQDLWTEVGRVKGGSDYPTQKPDRLLERIIRIGSHEGALVCDVFCGSGTTLVAAGEHRSPMDRV